MRNPVRASAALLVTCLSIGSALSAAGCGGGDGDGSGGGGTNQPGVSAPYPEVQPNGQIRGEGNFAALMKRASEGRVRAMPWAGYWWPYSDGGISGAAALHDGARGTSAAAWERSNHGPGVPGLQSWFGHCNGWAAAAVLYEEPREATSAGGVSFGVAERKALLSEIAMEVNADFFGLRNEDNDASSPSFQDVSPDVFFLVLANYVGNGLGLVIDRYTGDQVWNHPIAGYRISPIRPEDYLGPASGGSSVHRVNVTAQLWWVRDDVNGGHVTEPFSFEDGASYESRTLRFEVWMDAPPVFDGSGNLVSSGTVVVGRQGSTAIGGAWRTSGMDPANSHPDYIWVPHSVTPSTQYGNPRLDLGWIDSTLGKRNPPR